MAGSVSACTQSLLSGLCRPGGTMVTYGGMAKQPVIASVVSWGYLQIGAGVPLSLSAAV